MTDFRDRNPKRDDVNVSVGRTPDEYLVDNQGCTPKLAVMSGSHGSRNLSIRKGEGDKSTQSWKVISPIPFPSNPTKGVSTNTIPKPSGECRATKLILTVDKVIHVVNLDVLKFHFHPVKYKPD